MTPSGEASDARPPTDPPPCQDGVASPSESRRLVVEMAELAGGLAHELRNPLSTLMINLKLLAEILEEEGAHPEQARRRALLKVDVLRHEAERLQSLFDQFLTLTRTYDLDRTEADVNDIVQRLVEFFAPSAKQHGIEIDLALSPAPLICLVEERLLRQALLNILINGEQAMPDGGQLRIRTEAEPDTILISVSDTGTGIAPEDRERILRPFFSTKTEGNGLGLSIAQRLVHEHGGSLDFESEPGHGTTFRIRLPRQPSPPTTRTAG